ncbi:MAG: hydroxymethylbilane synthase [Bacteroidia bacterium]
MSKNKITIGSRGSDLALWQANFIFGELKKIGQSAEIKIIKTQGDKIQDLSFDKLEGKGFFTKEIEDALLSGEIDLAVHSHKDLPTESPEGLIIAAVSEREDPSELILIRKECVDEKQKFSFKKNAIVGTSSARRKSQLLAFRSDVKITDLRGNIPTRIQKLRDKKYDAIMLAAAGVERLQLDISEFHTEKISPKEFVPAPAQGVLALQIREKDKALFDLLQKINFPDVAETLAVERKVLNLFDGGCQLPLGVYCEKEEDENGEFVFKTWISRANAWNDFPKQMYFESLKTEGLAEKIVAKINSIKSNSVFITRNFRTADYFRNALSAQGFTVNAKSLIEFKKIIFRTTISQDWIFFSSKHAVKYFFEQKPMLSENTKIGTIGKATADEIRKFGKRADFIGYSTDTRLTGKQFAAVVGRKSVLFPQAKGGMKSIQQNIPQSQVTDLSVYETIEFSEVIPFAETLVFTSPSNVESFFKKNKISPEQKIVAMGDATANTLKKFKIRVHKQPITFDDLGLVQAVLGV